MIDKAEHVVIVGLGNPGSEYETTRHNLGFLVVQTLAAMLKVSFTKQPKFEAQVASLKVGDKRVHLVLPETYMNESGRACERVLNYYKLTSQELIVVTDDLALPFGQLRIRLMGSAGGHNGLKSIQAALGTTHYLRLKMGIGASDGCPYVDYVLGHFTGEEKKQLGEFITRGVECLKRLITEDFYKVANSVNRRLMDRKETDIV